MQIILNIILKEHRTAVPGTEAIPFPVDISRSLTCHPDNSSYNNPEIIEIYNTSIIGLENLTITDCHDSFANFLNDYEQLVNLAEILTNETITNEIDNYKINTLARPQDLLFNLPMFYIGK